MSLKSTYDELRGCHGALGRRQNCAAGGARNRRENASDSLISKYGVASIPWQLREAHD
jgi:hypothetical protein